MGHYGEHLNNNTSNITTSTRIPWFPNNNVVISNLVVGHHTVLAISSTGDLYSWGYNGHGQRVLVLVVVGMEQMELLI